MTVNAHEKRRGKKKTMVLYSKDEISKSESRIDEKKQIQLQMYMYMYMYIRRIIKYETLLGKEMG